MENHKLNTQLLSTQGSSANQCMFRPDSRLESSKIMFNSKVVPYAIPKQTPRSRLNVSFVCQPPSKSYSPVHSAVSSKHEEYYRSIQWSLLSENRNLKEHIDFLSTQIKSMFQRQKRQTEVIKAMKAKNKHFQMINFQLQQQLYSLTNQTLSQIQRIQYLLKTQKSESDQLLLSSASKSQQLGSETEVTINNHLEEFKAQISSIITNCQVKRVKFVISQREDESTDTINKHPVLHYEADKVDSDAKQEREYSFYENQRRQKYFSKAASSNHYFKESHLAENVKYTKK